MPEPARTPVVFAERLWPGPVGWALAVGFGVALGIALFPVGVAVAATTGLVALAAAVAVLVAWSPRVDVTADELRAGGAHIALSLLGPARVIERDGLQAELGPRLDARAHLCQRGWIRSAVRVELVDPADPTPYWIVSSRRPHELAAALGAGA